MASPRATADGPGLVVLGAPPWSAAICADQLDQLDQLGAAGSASSPPLLPRGAQDLCAAGGASSTRSHLERNKTIRYGCCVTARGSGLRASSAHVLTGVSSMVPTQALIDASAAAIAADTNALAAALFLHVFLVKNNFVPSAGLVVGDLSKADFTGATAKATISATMQTFKDPQTGEWIIQIPEIAGGWHWQTGDTVNLPQTVYGYAVTNVGETVLWGTALLPTPILLNGAGQGVDVGQVRFRLSANCLS